MSLISEIKIQKKTIFCKAAALFFPFLITAQTPQAYYQNKLNTYFSRDREVKNLVSITEEGIFVYSSAHAKAAGKKPEIKLTWNEITALKYSISSLSEKELEKLLLQKKDSLLLYIKKDSLGSYNLPVLSLKNMKIAIDPGHIGGSFEMGEAESRCMKLILDSTKQIQLVEGNLTFFTAMVLKEKLEEQGAIVMLTRPDTGISSLGINFFEWKKKIKNRVYRDSLLKCGLISEKKIKALRARLPDKTLFEKVFGSIDLAERARKINDFKPDVTVVIHYNVNEKNKGWSHTTGKDYVMAFVPGCITAIDLITLAGRLNFLRLLISPDIENSVMLSSLLVNHLSANLNVPVVQKKDASYLAERCLPTPAQGVYSRDLALTRLIKGTLVYGEPLYQDNEKECMLLTATEDTVQNYSVSHRLVLVANAYYKSIVDYISAVNKK